jgi:AcrR family transcriptional regulator
LSRQVLIVKKPAKAPQARLAAKKADAHVGNRYGRSEAARQAILEAADNLLVELGFAAVTIEGIAARAGVGKQTIYRWWKSKTEVLLDAFLGDAAQHLTPNDSGDLLNDLREHLHRYARFFESSDAGAVFRALIGEAQHDATLAEQLRSKYLDQQRTRDRLVLIRAIERGEARADIDVDQVIELMIAPIHYRVLVTGQTVNRRFTDSLARLALSSVKA